MAGRRRAPTRSTTRPHELFLSHAGADRRFTTRLGAVLIDHGVPTWYSETDVNAEQWHDEIGRALKRCDWFAVVLTPAGTKSPWVKDELLYAMRDARYRGHIIPLLVKTCDPDALSWTLLNRQFIDFRRRPFDDACRELLRRWGIGYRA